MKQVLVVFLMFFTFSGFANLGNISNEIEFQAFDVAIEQNQMSFERNSLNNSYTATCFVTIRNSQTGETREIRSTGTGSTPSAAMSSCASNARATAYMVVAILNN